MNIIHYDCQEIAHKVIDIIKELKSTYTGCYIDKIFDVAKWHQIAQSINIYLNQLIQNKFEELQMPAKCKVTNVQDIKVDKRSSLS